MHGRSGIVFGSLTPPEELATSAALAEGLGFDELCFSGDCFCTALRRFAHDVLER